MKPQRSINAFEHVLCYVLEIMNLRIKLPTSTNATLKQRYDAMTGFFRGEIPFELPNHQNRFQDFCAPSYSPSLTSRFFMGGLKRCRFFFFDVEPPAPMGGG